MLGSIQVTEREQLDAYVIAYLQRQQHQRRPADSFITSQDDDSRARLGITL